MEGSLSELRQIAHVSAHMSQLHMATAFHLRTSNDTGGLDLESSFPVRVPSLVGGATVSTSILVCMYIMLYIVLYKKGGDGGLNFLSSLLCLLMFINVFIMSLWGEEMEIRKYIIY